jgi:hypothetical protein
VRWEGVFVLLFVVFMIPEMEYLFFVSETFCFLLSVVRWDWVGEVVDGICL